MLAAYTLIVLLSSLIQHASSHANGAPCMPGLGFNLTPNHCSYRGCNRLEHATQAEKPIIVAPTCYIPGQPLQVEIRAPGTYPPTTFRGFSMYAYCGYCGIRKGHFTPIDGQSQPHQCMANGAVYREDILSITHTSNQEKSSVSMLWTPPADYNKNIQFRATVVKTKEEYWENIGTQYLHPCL